MKKLMIVAAAACAAFASCGESKSIKSFNTIDSLSYAIGVDFATNSGVRGIEDSTLNGSLLAAAFRDVFDEKTQMTPEDATAFINEWFTVRVPAKAKAESQAWLDEVKADNSNVQTTASGLMYEIVNAGDVNVKATNDADQVVVNYKGTLKDGTVFDSRDSISFALNRVIAAWTEGMKLVGKGGEVTLWVPSELGYGAQQSGPIPANSALKFEIKLLDVVPATAE
ncbi:MAG: FKBP-type peptidyl-prolyl cis-trans isomerase [Alistipes sp.]|jgi:FKBP-type peptidyl-prolyl cis-trans isomerase|nr:FKBP-type peptidyl-prolyl cis-trans isomerase [Alistipes sp.]